MLARMQLARRAVVASSVAVLGTLLVQVPALASDPVPTTTAEAKVLVDKLTAQQREAERQYNDLNTAATLAAGVMDERTAEIEKQTEKVDKLRTSVGAMALSRYQNRGKETTAALVTSDTQQALRKLATIDHADSSLNANLQSLQAENGYLTELAAKQKLDAAQATKDRDKLADLDRTAKDKLARAQATLDLLTEADRKAYEADQQRKQAEAEQSRAYTARTETNVPAAPAANAPATNAPAKNTPAPAPAPAPKPAPAPEPVASVPSSGGLRSSANARGNVYDYGSCVWWAYARRAQMGAPVGSYWGSALSWPGRAAAEGFRVDHSPEVGAVMIAAPGVLGSGGMGHAAVVESVNGGSFTISEMNAPVAGSRTSRTIPISSAGWVSFIH